jgi:hypothetical protein
MLRAPRRHVFKQHLDFLDPAIKKQYKMYTDKSYECTGKRQRVNEIINAVVPRSAVWSHHLRPSQLHVDSTTGETKAREDRGTDVGYQRITMLWTHFAGNEDAFDRALAAGEMSQRGHYYFVKQRQKRSSTRAESTVRGVVTHDVDGILQHRSVLSHAMHQLIEDGTSDCDCASHSEDVGGSPGGEMVRGGEPADGAYEAEHTSVAVADSHHTTEQGGGGREDTIVAPVAPTSASPLLADARPAEESDFRALLTAFKRCILFVYYNQKHCADILWTIPEAVMRRRRAGGRCRWDDIVTGRRVSRGCRFKMQRVKNLTCARSRVAGKPWPAWTSARPWLPMRRS